MDYQGNIGYEPLLARRAVAAALDYLLFFASCCMQVYAFGDETTPGHFEAISAYHVLVIPLLWFLFFPVMEGVFGHTLFKGIFDLEVVAEKKGDSRFAIAFKRHLLDPVDFLLFGLSAIMLVKRRHDRKRLGDIVAYTNVRHSIEKKTVVKIYFWVMAGLLGLTYSQNNHGIWELVDLTVSAIAWGGLFLFAYSKKLLSSTFWLIYACLFLIWELAFNIVIHPKVSGHPFQPMTAIVGFTFLLPLYVGLFRYRSFVRNIESIIATGAQPVVD